MNLITPLRAPGASLGITATALSLNLVLLGDASNLRSLELGYNNLKFPRISAATQLGLP